MKKIIFSLLVTIAFFATAVAQEDKYTVAMQSKVAMVDTVRNPTELLALSDAFARIAEAEKTKWLPYYYAALAQVNAAYFMTTGTPDASKTDPMADKAEGYISKAEAVSPKNSEIYIVKKMIARLRMMADPMSRYMTYGPQAEEALQTAMKLNPENPRVYLLQAEDKYFTPEQFGGSKEEAKQLFGIANQKYAAFKPATPLDPTWGKQSADYFLSQIK